MARGAAKKDNKGRTRGSGTKGNGTDAAEVQTLALELHEFEKTWYANRSRLNRGLPVQNFSVNLRFPMEESIDELMMMVSSEMNWTVGDMIAMDVIRFLRIVGKVKRKIRARNDAIEKSNKSHKK